MLCFLTRQCLLPERQDCKAFNPMSKIEYISATCCHTPFENDVIDLPQQGMHDHDGLCNQYRPLTKTLCLHCNKLSDTLAVQYIYSSCSPNWAIEYNHVHPAQEVKLLLELRYTHIKCPRPSNKLRVNNGAYMFDSMLSWPGYCKTQTTHLVYLKHSQQKEYHAKSMLLATANQNA